MRLLMKGSTARFVLALALGVLAYVFASALMFTSGFMISLAATIPVTVLVLHLPSIFVRIFGIGKPVIQYAHRLASHEWVLRLTSRLRLMTYRALGRKVQALDPRQKTGRVVEVLVSDIGHAQDLVLRGVLPIAIAWVVAVMLLLLAGALSLPLAMALLACLVVSTVVVPMLVASANVRKVDEVRNVDHHLYVRLMDDMSGLSDWVLSGRTDELQGEVVGCFGQRRECSRYISRMRRMNNMICQTLFCCCILALLVWAADAFGNASSLGGLAGVMANASSANYPGYAPNWIGAFALCFFPLIEAFLAVEPAFEEFYAQSSGVRDLEEFAGPYLSDAEGFGAECGSAPWQCSGYDVSLEGVSFAYPGSIKPVLEGFSINIPFGSKVLVTGPSGAGKTTLAKTIHGDVLPQDGSATIGGVDISEMRSRIHELVGIVEQDPYLFDMSLAGNLRVASPDATDKELMEAIDMVGLGAMVSKLEQGLDTRLLEQGMRFSGGEAQRVAVARVLLARQPIVILDEPLANLDEETGTEVLDAVMRVFEGKTLVVIAHNLDADSRFDAVIEIDG